MYIPTDAENPEAAKEFIKFLYTDDIVKEMAEATNALPPLKNCLELVDGLVDDATYVSAELGLSDDMVQVSGGFANTSATDITIRSDFFQGVGSILNGDMDRCGPAGPDGTGIPGTRTACHGTAGPRGRRLFGGSGRISERFCKTDAEKPGLSGLRHA